MRGEMFNGWVMGYGWVMVFLLIMLVVIGVFGNHLMVMEVVEGDMVWLRLNGISVGVFVGGLVMFVGVQWLGDGLWVGNGVFAYYVGGYRCVW